MLKYSRTRATNSPLKEKRMDGTYTGSGLPVTGNSSMSPLAQMHAETGNGLSIRSNHHKDRLNNLASPCRNATGQIVRTICNGGTPDTQNPMSLPEIIKIYTDWANHYLEKGQKKRVISDLQKDMQDSVLLVDVIEAVTGDKVPDIKRKPKNAVQVVENIGYCLQYLSNLGVCVDGLTAKDIRDGQLKAILSLFFSLSRYKQQQKSAAQQQQQHESSGVVQNRQNSLNQNDPCQQRNHSGIAISSNDMLSRLPSPFKSANANSANSTATNGNAGSTSATASDSGSSGIPSLSGSTANRQLGKQTAEKKDSTREAPSGKSAVPSGLKTPSVVVNGTGSSASSRLPAPGNTALGHNSAASSSSTTTKSQLSSGLKPPSATKSQLPSVSGSVKSGSGIQAPASTNDGKMLEKLKLFGKEKSGAGSSSGSTGSGTNSPRLSSSSSKSSSTSSSIRGPSSTCTTSSSGFSSGKSEMSDSTSSSSKIQSQIGGSKPCSPKMSLKGLTKKSLIGGKSAAPSPKLGRKEIAKSISGNNIQTSPMIQKKSAQQQTQMISSTESQNSRNDDTDSNCGGCENTAGPSLIAPQKKSNGDKKLPCGNGIKLGIPKPTMAVKGTTKPVAPIRDESTRLETVTPSGLAGLAKPSSLPKTNSRQKLSNTASSAGAAASAAPESSQTNSNCDNEKTAQRTLTGPNMKHQSGSTAISGINPMSPSSAGGAVVGVVSPITHHKKTTATMVPSGGADLNSSLESTVGHQSDSNSSQTSGNQSDAASVIYCPSGEETMAGQKSAQARPAGSNRVTRSARVPSTDQAVSSKLRELSASSSGRTQSRLETTFDSSDGVIVTTQTLTSTATGGSSDEDEEAAKTGYQRKTSSHSGQSDPSEQSDGCCSEAGGEEELAPVVIEPMAPLATRNSPYAYLKNYVTAGGTTVGTQSSAGSAGLAGKPPLSTGKRTLNQQEQIHVASASPVIGRAGLVRAKSPRLLLNKPLAALLHADANGDASNALEAIRQATTSADLAAGGYVSDGDVLTLASAISTASKHQNSISATTPTCAGPSGATSASGTGGVYGVGDLDISGYMSEGGISLYARKMQARFREGLEAVRDSMRERKAADYGKMTMENFVDDSCEDSSSLSSGISEAFDEISTDDLTGSSLSDHAAVGQFYTSSTPGHKRSVSSTSQQHHLRKTVECGQQTESGENRSRRGGAGDLKKISDQQYDRQKIDVLLQKSRTNSRGQGANSGSVAISASGRPKSEQMTTMMMNEIQLSADGQTLRVAAAPNFGYAQPNQQQRNGKRMPLATNSLKILKTDLANFGNHRTDLFGQTGPSGVGQPVLSYSSGNGNGNGYHSLDRKKHLLTYHDLDPTFARHYYSDAESMYVNYGNVAVPRTNAGTTLALVSPRRMPHHGMIRKMDGMQQHQHRQQTGEGWARHSIAGNRGKQIVANGGVGSNINNNPVNGTGSTMTRSMIEPELLLKPGHHHHQHQQMSVGDASASAHMNANNYQHRMNGHARLSIPSQNVLQSGLSTTQSPRLAKCNSSQTDSFGVQKDGGAGHYSPYTQKILTNSPTSAGVAGFPDPGLPPSPGSLSDRGPPGLHCRSSHLSAATQSPYAATMVGVITGEEVHASSLSLASTSSSVYSSAEEKYQSEIRKLRREIDNYRDKVQTLTTQQATYAHVVAAFEQALQSMTKRVQTLMISREQKDYEVVELKQTIDALRQLSVAAGVNVDEVLAPSPSLHRRHTFTNNGEPQGLSRQMSAESMHSAMSQKSSHSSGSAGGKSSISGGKSIGGNETASPTNSQSEKKHKKSWLRSSFSKAFGKGKSKTSGKGPNGAVSDIEESSSSPRRPALNDVSYPNSPMHNAKRNSTASGQLKPAGSLSGLDECGADDRVEELRMQLEDKKTKLTDIRLEALTSAHQVDQLKEEMTRMRMEIVTLRNEKHRLERALCTKSRAGSQTSLPLLSDDNESVSECSHVLSDMSVPISVDASLGDGQKEGFRIQVSVSLEFSGDVTSTGPSSALIIGSLCLTTRAKWDLVDTFVFKLFKEYVLRIDPVSNLGLSAESIVGYRLGKCHRVSGENSPDISPGDVFQGDHTLEHGMMVVLKGVKQNAVDCLAFGSLIPKCIVQRYVQSLMDDRRIILCSLAGTGKTYLARKLAEYLVIKHGKSGDGYIVCFDGGETIATGSKVAISVKSFFHSLRDEKSQTLPIVVILDNLHNMGPLNDLLSNLPNAMPNCPYIIGTMSQTNHCTTTLQLQHNFRWHPCANYTEPIKGFLGRFLRRRLVESEVKRMSKYPVELWKVLDWLPKVWSHLNKYLEIVNSSDASIGPAQLMECPLDLVQSRQWFVHLWNNILSNYIHQKTSEGLRLYQKRASLQDPYEFVVQSWPWTSGDAPENMLIRIGHDTSDGGYGRSENAICGTEDPNDVDPLVMLMRLQQQAKCQSDDTCGEYGISNVPFRHGNRTGDAKQENGTESTF